MGEDRIRRREYLGCIDQLGENLQELLKWGIAQGQIERYEKDDPGVG
jgi:hypothetical protein